MEAAIQGIIGETIERVNTDNHRWVKDFKESVDKVCV